MPMIEFRYHPGKIAYKDAEVIGAGLENALRFAISGIRPKKEGYGVTVEGDPFGPIAHNQPDLRLYVFYHEEWGFTDNDLDCLVASMVTHIQVVLSRQDLNVKAVVRFYLRAGHASAKIG